MPKLRRLKKSPTSRLDSNNYDVEELAKIIRAMEYLSNEAKKIGIEEVTTVVESAFKILHTSYYCILRHRMMDLPGADESLFTEE